MEGDPVDDQKTRLLWPAVFGLAGLAIGLMVGLLVAGIVEGSRPTVAALSQANADLERAETEAVALREKVQSLSEELAKFDHIPRHPAYDVSTATKDETGYWHGTIHLSKLRAFQPLVTVDWYGELSDLPMDVEFRLDDEIRAEIQSAWEASDIPKSDTTDPTTGGVWIQALMTGSPRVPQAEVVIVPYLGVRQGMILGEPLQVVKSNYLNFDVADAVGTYGGTTLNNLAEKAGEATSLALRQFDTRRRAP